MSSQRKNLVSMRCLSSWWYPALMTLVLVGWWLVCVNDNQKGWAPATYLEPVNVAKELESHKVVERQPSEGIGSVKLPFSGCPF